MTPLDLVVTEAVRGRNYYTHENCYDAEAVADLVAALRALGYVIASEPDDELVQVRIQSRDNAPHR